MTVDLKKLSKDASKDVGAHLEKFHLALFSMEEAESEGQDRDQTADALESCIEAMDSLIDTLKSLE